VDASTVHGLYAPAGTPRDIVLRLNRELERTLASAPVRAMLSAVTAEPVSASPEQFAAQLARDRERFGAIIREANIRSD